MNPFQKDRIVYIVGAKTGKEWIGRISCKRCNGRPHPSTQRAAKRDGTESLLGGEKGLKGMKFGKSFHYHRWNKILGQRRKKGSRKGSRCRNNNRGSC
jgi:hypothetical protein